MEPVLVNVIVRLSWLLEFNNNLILQYGYTATGYVTLPIAYTAHYSVCLIGNDTSIDYTNKYYSKTLVSFETHGIQVAYYTGSLIPADWITLGY